MQFNRFQTLADILILIGLVIFGALVFGLLGIIACIPFLHMDLAAIQQAVLDTANPANTGIIKLFNLFATFGAWVVSSFVFIRMRQYSLSQTWQLRLPGRKIFIWVLPLICLALLFISSFLLQVNSAIPLPESVRNLTSEANKELLGNMLRMDNVNQLILNIFIIGLAPALFEEIFFRGTLQRLLIHLFGNAHVGVWLTSFIFAMIHLNMNQILPMFALALVLGYICYYTKSLWPSVILHFFNNSAAVLVNYLEDKSELAAQLAADTYAPPFIITLLSLLIVAYYLYSIIQQYRKEEVPANE